MVRGGFVALGLVAAVVAALVAGTSAQSSGCTTAIISLAPCLGFIQGNSTAPPSSCCTQLASVVQSQPRCLCQVLNGGTGPLAIAVNRTQALALPAACKVQTPPVSQCNAVAGPAASPTEAPAPAPSPATPTPSSGGPAPSSVETPSSDPATPASQSPAAGGGSSKTTGGGSTSAGNSNGIMTLSISFSALCIIMASYASTAGFF